MTADTPWINDACSLVDAFRRRERSPVEELEATLAAVERSELNAFSFIGAEEALEQARNADTSLPFGGVPFAVKELTNVKGWPSTESSLVFKDRVAQHDAVMVERMRAAGAVVFGLTTASEFGGVNFTRTKLNGTTTNPWNTERTPGGSSGGSSAAVAGGLCTIASAGDGGGSIRIPAAFTGLPGLKNTYGRIPKAPQIPIGSLTAVTGCLSRSVRDIARFLDVTNGAHPRDPLSLPRIEGWEDGIGTREVNRLRATILPEFGGAVVDHEVMDLIISAGEALIADAGLTRVEARADLPSMGTPWALAGSATILMELGEAWPECGPDLTPQIKFLLDVAIPRYDLRGRAQLEERRVKLNEAMADLFDQTDLVITPTCPDVAFGAATGFPDEVNGRKVDSSNSGALTIPANTYGNPGISIPVGTVRGMPVGMQVMARHHQEAVLLDLAALVERERPWPLVAPLAPC
ncbi:MAG TPA: amidase [Acidimicrobiales bacterium]|jgi:Asp-tRNA(Asn)/Glu-tRNA(Gln) amidotransferase A subunit family amidase|nr:amidase [Acidimicrobiales bacterium]